MLSKATLETNAGAEVTLHEDAGTSKRIWKSVAGLVGLGHLRDSKRVRPQAHGSLNETRFEEGRTITIDGEVFAPGNIEEAFAEFRKLTTVMLETLEGEDNDGNWLRWTEAVSGNKLQMRVKLDSEVLPTLAEGFAYVQYVCQLYAADPRAYSQTQTTTLGAGITGTSFEGTFVKSSSGTLLGGIAVDSTKIYWPGATGIDRAAIAGGTIEAAWIALGKGPAAVAVDASHIYWATYGSGKLKIGRAAIGGTAVEENWITFTSELRPNNLAVNGSNVFWTYKNGLTVGRAAIGGGSVESAWLTLPHNVQDGAFAIDSAHIYFGQKQTSSIGRCSLAGASIEGEFIKGIGNTAGIAVNATNIFWLLSSGGALGRAKLAGTEVISAFISGIVPTNGLAVDASHLYWPEGEFVARSTNLSGGPTGGAVKSKNAGNRPTPLTLKITGPITNPSVSRADGTRIALSGEIPSGNYVELNTADRTAKLNGSSNVLNMVNASATDWSAFEAPPSPTEETYTLTGSTATAATLEIIYRSAFA